MNAEVISLFSKLLHFYSTDCILIIGPFGADGIRAYKTAILKPCSGRTRMRGGSVINDISVVCPEKGTPVISRGFNTERTPSDRSVDPFQKRNAYHGSCRKNTDDYRNSGQFTGLFRIRPMGADKRAMRGQL